MIERGIWRKVLTGLIGLGLAISAAQSHAQQRSNAEMATRHAKALQTYADFCGEGMLSAVISGGQVERVTFSTESGRYAQLTVCDDKHEIALGTPIEFIDTALVFMAFRPFEKFWPAAEAKWGADLSLLRQDIRAEVFSKSLSTRYGKMMNRRVDRARARAATLDGIGYHEEGLELLGVERDRLLSERSLKRTSLSFERVMTASGTANILANWKGQKSAAESLAAFKRLLPDDHGHMINLEINRAAYLAEAGEFQAALDLILPTYEEFKVFQRNSITYRIGGSDREFAWIIACAYSRLGQAEKAEPYLEIIDTAKEKPADQYLSETKRSSSIKLRLAGCMDDPQRYFATMFSGEVPPLSSAWVEMQFGHHSNSYYFQSGWTMPDDVQQKYSAKYRKLPIALRAASYRWTLDDVDPPVSGSSSE